MFLIFPTVAGHMKIEKKALCHYGCFKKIRQARLFIFVGCIVKTENMFEKTNKCFEK